jgi:hypothetical protein
VLCSSDILCDFKIRHLPAVAPGAMSAVNPALSASSATVLSSTPGTSAILRFLRPSSIIPATTFAISVLVVWERRAGEVGAVRCRIAASAGQTNGPRDCAPGAAYLPAANEGQWQTGYYCLSIPPGSCYCVPMICALAPFSTCSHRTPGRPIVGIPCRWNTLPCVNCVTQPRARIA